MGIYIRALEKSKVNKAKVKKSESSEDYDFLKILNDYPRSTKQEITQKIMNLGKGYDEEFIINTIDSLWDSNYITSIDGSGLELTDAGIDYLDELYDDLYSDADDDDDYNEGGFEKSKSKVKKSGIIEFHDGMTLKEFFEENRKPANSIFGFNAYSVMLNGKQIGSNYMSIDEQYHDLPVVSYEWQDMIDENLLIINVSDENVSKSKVKKKSLKKFDRGYNVGDKVVIHTPGNEEYDGLVGEVTWINEDEPKDEYQSVSIRYRDGIGGENLFDACQAKRIDKSKVKKKSMKKSDLSDKNTVYQILNDNVFRYNFGIEEIDNGFKIDFEEDRNGAEKVKSALEQAGYRIENFDEWSPGYYKAKLYY